MSNQETGIIEINELDTNFKYEIAARPGGKNFKRCFSCGTCTASCPVSEVDNEYNPRRIIRMALLGMRKQVLSSGLLWYCARCYTCYALCPQDVKFIEIMNVLRDMAVEQGYISKEMLSKIDKIDKC